MSVIQADRVVAVETPLGEDVLVLAAMTGSDELGRLYEYQLDLISETSNIDVNKLLGNRMTVRLKLPDGGLRYFNGCVSRFDHVSVEGELCYYRATLVPWLWLLTCTADCRIFQDVTVPEIIMEVFRQHGFSDFENRLTSSYRTWEYCCQYRETAFNFVSRLMEQEGIYYFFEHDENKHTLVLADSIGAHGTPQGYERVRYYQPSEASIREEHISDWSVSHAVKPGGYALKEYDFKNPGNPLLSKAKVEREHRVGDFEIYDFAGEYDNSHEGDHYARARILALSADAEVGRAQSNARGLSCGSVFEFTYYPVEDQCGKYLITSTSFEIQSNVLRKKAADGSTFKSHFRAIRHDVPFRSAMTTPVPYIKGPQTAVVVGRPGDEICTDEFGRVKVQFHWDRYGGSDENSSCWIRVAQSWAGKKWGMVFIPRVGQEVIIEFLEGDPDHPIVTGRVYNANQMPPYELPANATQSGIKSNSSKGGGGANEIRFQDMAGSEEVYIHAQKDQTIIVENDKTEQVKHDEAVTIDHDRTENVGHDEIRNIGNDRTLEVGNNEAVNIAKTQTVTVGEEVTLNAGKKITLVAGDEIKLQTGGATLFMKSDGTIVLDGANVLVKASGQYVYIADGITGEAKSSHEFKGATVKHNC